MIITLNAVSPEIVLMLPRRDRIALVWLVVLVLAVLVWTWSEGFDGVLGVELEGEVGSVGFAECARS